ncbi:diphosphomevalonate decarboxylase [uncultured Corynebacterium sp.]|uniref:diphosphomevalonate decarboxylase n=1 Tax=uncultured Corynebacterium sp. TaxID=159447 RepID=UPI0025E09E96|nr:diphosphomevalonate decarboxylase [uncultured Corynebacterium sp.]
MAHAPLGVPAVTTTHPSMGDIGPITPHTARATAHPNIALVKYWGKRNADLVLPATGSLSLTLDIYPTDTVVNPDPGLTSDIFTLNGEPAPGTPTHRVSAFLDLVRKRSAEHGSENSGQQNPELAHTYARVNSINSVPTGAGLASSASGFAALATAASKAYGLPGDPRSLSRLARRGSGSATRSVLGNLVIWHPGDGDDENGDLTSYAENVPGPDLAMVICVVSGAQKAVSSRVAMADTVRTSPFFDGWVTSTQRDLVDMKRALGAGDYTRVGGITESNALRMHAAINGNRPPVRYLAPTSVAIFDAIAQLRNDGLEVYGTADAGPNVVALCQAKDLDATHRALHERFPNLELIPARAGSGAQLTPIAETSAHEQTIANEGQPAQAPDAASRQE